MASLQYDSSLYPILVALAIVGLFVSPISSTSRGTLSHQTLETGFRVTLQHVDSGKNLTKLERIQHAMKRGRNRLQRLNAMALVATPESQLQTQVHAGDGEYLMNLAIGTPPVAFSAVMDTGSDLIWTQCKPCTQCYKQPTPIFDPKQSSSYSKMPCSSNLCGSVSSSSCHDDGCEYAYIYGDYSMTQGIMATETFTFGESGNNVSVPNIGFGCGEDNEGDGFSQGGGIVGLGRGSLSLVSQLKEPKFSYCLTSTDDSKTSTLSMGSLASMSSTQKTITTPLITNPSQPSFYYLSLEGISVGGTKLPLDKLTFDLEDDGSGGLIIDSGTTITYLEESAFRILKKEFISKTKLPLDTSGLTGLDVCFYLPSDHSSQKLKIPKLVFHFKGGDLELPGENYMVVDSDLGVACLAMGAASDMSIFGNMQQQNLLVLHDLKKETISFVPTQCDQL
ncbi:aspartic proteinase nepenthesin-1 [Quillaja saponaria]|uniref:Aspartic proteinase nepenthesin-1 n=1 Tax=Quillaja saponaria TaxID=32244 RepID=A0AAD7KSZ1_QUISA|nr:aspartic proteinase nepenthesin-1 [Quillaja saponaria]